MKTTLLLGCLALLASHPVSAQTGRIAYLSHSGSPVALAAQQEAAADNFGVIRRPVEVRVDSLVYVTDSTAVRYTHQREGYYRKEDQSGWKPVKESRFQYYYSQYGHLTRDEALARLREEYAAATFSGFDKKPPVLKRKAKHKKAALVRPLPPRRPRPWQGAGLVTGLLGLGWRLAARHRPLAPNAAA